MKGLTQKQEAYARGVLFEKKTKRQAYRDAYPKSANARDETIDTNIWKLENSPRFFQGFQKLQAEAEAVLNITRDDVLNELRNIGFCRDTNRIKTRDQLTALSMIKKMLGYEEAQRMDVTVSEDSRIIHHLHLPDDGMEDADGDNC